MSNEPPVMIAVTGANGVEMKKKPKL